VSPRLDRLRSLISREQPLAPVHDAFDIRLTEVSAGRCAARMPAELLVTQRDPRSAGPLFVLADGVLGVAISSTLPEDRGVTTLGLSMRTHASWWPSSGWLTATAGADDVDDEAGTSRGEIRDADARLLATFDTRCAVIDAPELWLSGDLERVDPAEAADATQRRLELGIDADTVTLTAPTGPGLGNARGALQGGVLALFADLLLMPLLDRRPERTEHSEEPAAPLRHDLSLHYLRAAAAGTIRGRAERVHPGRRLSTARAELHDATGRLLVTATGLGYTP
jgi:uncharacterized protein (TIGR00369 family)